MLSFLAGVVVFIFLFVGKWCLARLLLYKKKVAFLLMAIVVSELFIVLILYFGIEKFKLDGVKILSGFLVALSMMIVYFGLRFFLTKKE